MNVNAVRCAEQFALNEVDGVGFAQLHFPAGLHVFSANGAHVRALDTAVDAALAESHLLLAPEREAALVAARAWEASLIEDHNRAIRTPHSGKTIETIEPEWWGRPFELAKLRAFLGKHRNDFVVGHHAMKSYLTGERVREIAACLGLSVAELVTRLMLKDCPGGFEIATQVYPTLELRLRRLEEVRGLNAPKVIVDNELEEALRTAQSDWRLIVDVESTMPDRIAAAVNPHAENGSQFEPLVYADLMPTLLLAVQCCVDPQTLSLADIPIDDLEWTEFGANAGEIETEVPRGACLVVPHIADADGAVERLAYCHLAKSSPLRKVAPGGYLLLTEMVDPTDEEE